MKTILLSFIFILSIVSLRTFAYESPDAFIVRVYDEKVRVLSPVKYDPQLSVIIENKTLVTLKAKVITESESSIEFISLAPSKTTSVKLKNLDKEKIYFIPMSPPLQRVELKLGSKPYEIPPRS